MSKLTKITRPVIKTMRVEMNAAMKAIAEKYGVGIDFTGASYDDMSIKFKVEVKIVGEDGIDLKAKKDFEVYASMYDLKPEDFGREFTSNGKRFKITGISPRSSVRPVLADEVGTGRGYKFPAKAVVAKLATAA